MKLIGDLKIHMKHTEQLQSQLVTFQPQKTNWWHLHNQKELVTCQHP